MSEKKTIPTLKAGFFKCLQCTFTTNDTAAYRSHKNSCISDSSEEIIEIVPDSVLFEPETFKCSICGKNYGSQSSLRTHQNYHSEYKAFACTHCTYRFSSQKALNRHVAIHEKVQHLECPHCAYTSNISGNMVVHIRTHSGLKPYKCMVCPYTAYSSTILNQHKLIHKKIKKYSCAECSYKTHRASLLTSHKLIHSTEKHYLCKICDIYFKTPHNLRYHLRNKHEEKNLLECPFCDYRNPKMSILKRHIFCHIDKE